VARGVLTKLFGTHQPHLTDPYLMQVEGNREAHEHGYEHQHERPNLLERGNHQGDEPTQVFLGPEEVEKLPPHDQHRQALNSPEVRVHHAVGEHAPDADVEEGQDV